MYWWFQYKTLFYWTWNILVSNTSIDYCSVMKNWIFLFTTVFLVPFPDAVYIISTLFHLFIHLEHLYNFSEVFPWKNVSCLSVLNCSTEVVYQPKLYRRVDDSSREDITQSSSSTDSETISTLRQEIKVAHDLLEDASMIFCIWSFLGFQCAL